MLWWRWKWRGGLGVRRFVGFLRYDGETMKSGVGWYEWQRKRWLWRLSGEQRLLLLLLLRQQIIKLLLQHWW